MPLNLVSPGAPTTSGLWLPSDYANARSVANWEAPGFYEKFQKKDGGCIKIVLKP